MGALDEFAVRFHLHPAVKASRRSDGHGAMLVLPNKDVWTFDSHEDRVELEESVYLGGSEGPRRTVQLVIHGRARQVPRVHWTFTHTPRQPRRRKARAPAARSRRTSRNCRCSLHLHCIIPLVPAKAGTQTDRPRFPLSRE